MKGEEDQAAKLASLERTVQEHPTSVAAWGELGAAYSEAGQHELAVSVLRRATRLGQDRPWAWYYLSVSLAQLDEGEAALGAARKAVAYAQPQCAFWMRVNLGRQLLQSSRPHEAVRHLEEATRMAPTRTRALGLLGVALFRTEQFGAAAECGELGRLDAGMAKSLRRRLRSLRSQGRAGAPVEAHEARAEEVCR